MPEDKASNVVKGSGLGSIPAPALPKGGGAIRGMGEKFAANPVTGTASLAVPLALSPSRSGFGPQLTLRYDSGAGNGPFGFGWSLSLPAVTRKTDRGLPQYRDAEESDVFVLAGAEDLVPVLGGDGTRLEDSTTEPGFVIHRYRPRVEGLFARIERWTHRATGAMHWRSITRDNVTSLYGVDASSRIADGPQRDFTWLISSSYDDKGNAVVYQYVGEDDATVDRTQANERNRTRTANRYLKRIRYGNRSPNRELATWRAFDPAQLQVDTWMFEAIFDYDERHCENIPLDPTRPPAEQHTFVLVSPDPGARWGLRPDPFSVHRSGFEVRTYRRCHRVLMFHHIPDLPGGARGYDGLVRAIEFDYADLNPAQPVGVDVELAHQGSTRFASFIRAVTQSGYVYDDARPDVVRNGVLYRTYLRKALAPLELEYSKAEVRDEVRHLDRGSQEHLPEGLGGASYEWVDLDGEGLSGILIEKAGALYYKANRGEGRFGPLTAVSPKPSLTGLSDSRQQLLDLAGDGQLDLVTLSDPVPGFYERRQDRGWEPFRAFRHVANVSWRDPNLRLVDLDGDGHSDVLITEQDAFTWHPSLAEEGFGAARRVPQSSDEERGPRLVFADGTQSIYLADMCGDGLTDLVRIRNGEVCYWPNVGYGRFGAKVAMDNAPRFDTADQFDQRRVRLADIDGSGTTDIIYLHRDGARLYFNQSGNRLTEARQLVSLPPVDNAASVMTADLLGNGTACLVWSSPLPREAQSSLRYIDLLGGVKPHLLVATRNNLGAETRVRYAPSTQFYLQDERDGRPWVTRLPFPVHVVERTIAYDHVGRTRFASRYAYHHGYFDGVEREFRGFGMVEQFDTEEFAVLSEAFDLPTGDNIDAASHVPPVLTKTWFHTGIHLGREHVSDFFGGLLDGVDKGEYYREPGLSDAQARLMQLPDTVLPPGLSLEEEREACRALKGSMLRQEVYALDGTDRQPHPYFVSEQTFAVRMLQSAVDRRSAVFLTHALESLTYHYERNPLDPRVQHALTLEVDEFGNLLKQVSIGYGRREPDASLPSDFDRAQQARTLVTYTESLVTNAIGDGPTSSTDYRTPLTAGTRTFELTGYTATGTSGRFQVSDLVIPDPADPAGVRRIAVFDSEIAYELQPWTGRQRRLIEHSRIRYRRDDLSGLLSVGDLEPLAMAGESYLLALTPGLLAQVFQRNGEPLLPDPGEVLPVDAAGGLAADRGGYVDLDGDGHWWVPSGRMFMSPDPQDPPAAELLHARLHFFLPRRYRDPFHTDAVSTEAVVAYDAYDLLLLESRDAAGNRVTVGERLANGDVDDTRSGNDYRTMQPGLLTDANGNRNVAVFDALGMVAGTAIMGKASQTQGDLLDASFAADLTEAQIDAFLVAPREAGATAGESAAAEIAHQLLGRATTRTVYDVNRFRRLGQPALSAAIARETHVSELAGQRPRLQIGIAYSDGFSRSIQNKVQAEPGPVPMRDAAGGIVLGADGQPVMTAAVATPRWVGSGWTVFNNKGKPVRQFEPFFTDTHLFEFDVRVGVSPVMFYDPVQRVVAALHPNHTWEKALIDAWRHESWDVNDTALSADPRLDPDVGDHFRRLEDDDYLPTWHALRTDPAHAAAFAAMYPDPAVRARETEAAVKAEMHAATPGIMHADGLGRTFLGIVHNRFERAGSIVDEHFATRSTLDVEGNQREAADARDRIIVRYDYNMLGARLHQASMEAGERWRLVDVAGQSLYAWDSRTHRFRTSYDRLRRAVEERLRIGAAPELLIGRTVYGEGVPDAEIRNLRGRIVGLFDQAGVVFTDLFDFKGNRLQGRRQFTREYKQTIDWSVDPELDPQQNFPSSMSYDALNRVLAATAPDGSISRPAYNEAGLLGGLAVSLHGAATETPFVGNIDYDAKGRRVLIERANGVRTAYQYDLLTSRHTRLITTRPAGLNGLATQLFKNPAILQDLHYTFDAIGNVTRIVDDALPTLFFANQQVESSSGFTYDAVYRLIETRGRESIRQNSLRLGSPQAGYRDYAYAGLAATGFDPAAVRNYTQRYEYDEAGNILRFRHQASSDAWARDYAYEEPSLIEAGKFSNRLTASVVGANGSQPFPETYQHDAHGNLTSVPHLASMQWDFNDRLHACARQVVNSGSPETTYYVYDATGLRVRKVTERQNGSRKCERSYLGGFEVYREYDATGADVELERETLHVIDDKQRLALVETRTLGTDDSPLQLIRYQLGNHLDSASLELDAAAHVISYEEYHPYGTTSYQAGRSAAEMSLKRYRYAGMERDDESGFSYHTARYYMPWLGRWASSDPAGLSDGVNLYAAARNNPVVRTDPNGTDSRKATSLSLDQGYTIRKFDADNNEVEREMHFVVPQNIRTVEAYKKWAAEQGIQIVGEVTMTFDRGERMFESEWFLMPGEPKKEEEDDGWLPSLSSIVDFGVSLIGPGKLRWGIRAYQFYKRWDESGSFLDALTDTAVNVVEDHIMDKTIGKLFGGKDSAGINSTGGGGKPRRGGGGGTPKRNTGTGGGGNGGGNGGSGGGKPTKGKRTKSANQSRLTGARRTARHDALDEVAEAARSGHGSERALHTIERLRAKHGTEAVVYLGEHGKFPASVTDMEFSHLFPASKYPEFAHKFEHGVITDRMEHHSGHHAGNVMKDLNGEPLDPDFEEKWGWQFFRHDEE